MQYLLMIYGDEAAVNGAKPEELKAMGEAYARFTQDIVQSGHLKGGDNLKPSNTATTLRRGDGKSLIDRWALCRNARATRWLLHFEAKDLDEAVAIADRIPFTAGAVEVRPINTMARQY